MARRGLRRWSSAGPEGLAILGLHDQLNENIPLKYIFALQNICFAFFTIHVETAEISLFNLIYG